MRTYIVSYKEGQKRFYMGIFTHFHSLRSRHNRISRNRNSYIVWVEYILRYFDDVMLLLQTITHILGLIFFLLVSSRYSFFRMSHTMRKNQSTFLAGDLSRSAYFKSLGNIIIVIIIIIVAPYTPSIYCCNSSCCCYTWNNRLVMRERER